MTVAEMLFIITKIMVKRAYFDDIISDKEYVKYNSRFSKIEDEDDEDDEDDEEWD